MKIIYTYPGKIPTDNETGWDSEWGGYSVERTISWNKYCDTISILEKHLPKKGKILEAGCGLGRIVVHFRNKNYDIMGVDWSGQAIRAIKAYNPDLPVSCGDVRHLDFPEGEFCAYISEGVIEHFQEGPLAILSEANRVLQKRGLLLLSVPFYNTFLRFTLFFKEQNLFRRLFRKPPLAGRKFDYYLFTLSELKRFLEKAGFKIIEFQPTLKAAGLYRSIPFFRNPKVRDEFDLWGHTEQCLNLPGRVFFNIFKNIAPWLFPTCVFCIASKEEARC